MNRRIALETRRAPARAGACLGVALGVALALGAVGCTSGSRARACDPVAQSGCDAPARCAIAADGAPACVTGGGSAGEGDACDDAAGCAQGLGCVRILGVARCVRFCATADRPDGCASLPASPPPSTLPEALRAAALCRVAVPDRTDLGACVLPCRPGAAEDCPAETTCGLAETLGQLACVPAGTLGPGESCGGGDLHCVEGLVCAPLGAGRVCVPWAAEAGCAEGTAAETLAVRPTDGTASADVCLPCDPLGPLGEGSARLGLCLAPTIGAGAGDCGAEATACACAVFGATVGSPLAATALDLLAANGYAAGGWVGVRVSDGVGTWLDGGAVAADAWAPGEPRGGACARLTAEGLVATECAEAHPVLCLATE